MPSNFSEQLFSDSTFLLFPWMSIVAFVRPLTEHLISCVCTMSDELINVQCLLGSVMFGAFDQYRTKNYLTTCNTVKKMLCVDQSNA